MIKTAIVLAIIGHILCGISDCLLSYSPRGRLNFKDISDQDKMSAMFADMPLSFPLASMIMGTFAITLFGFGYFALCFWMKEYSGTAANIMFIATVVFLVSIVVHHVLCGVVEWGYIRLGRTAEARTAMLELQKKTISTMAAGYAGWLTLLVTLFVMVVRGMTGLPAWGCVFNTAVIMLPIAPTKIPAKGNVAGAVMFIGLLFLV
ncbi:MAG: hypothetical protein K6B72_01615 [Lachnospiraceae bacterium]|nr:hypothetical protein [Lachnospiraceae bacterium]